MFTNGFFKSIEFTKNILPQIFITLVLYKIRIKNIYNVEKYISNSNSIQINYLYVFISKYIEGATYIELMNLYDSYGFNINTFNNYFNNLLIYCLQKKIPNSISNPQSSMISLNNKCLPNIDINYHIWNDVCSVEPVFTDDFITFYGKGLRIYSDSKKNFSFEYDLNYSKYPFDNLVDILTVRITYLTENKNIIKIVSDYNSTSIKRNLLTKYDGVVIKSINCNLTNININNKLLNESDSLLRQKHIEISERTPFSYTNELNDLKKSNTTLDSYSNKLLCFYKSENAVIYLIEILLNKYKILDFITSIN